MKECTILGIDLAKNIFRMYGIDKHGKCLINKNIHRERLGAFLETLPPCVVAMEACGSSHYWGRRAAESGHTARLIHPKYVTPFRMGDKNDANDAMAICEAVQRPTMRFVPLKTQEQTDIQALHRTR